MKHIIHKVRKWISGAKPAAEKTTVIYVMVSPKQQGHADMYSGDPTPILRRLSSFSAREALPVVAIFPGKASRKIPDGAHQSGVTVRYAMPDQVVKITEQSAKDAGKTSSVVVVTDHPLVEKYATNHHLKTMRLDTFEKALESVAGPVRREIRKQDGGAPRPAAPQQENRRQQETRKPEEQAQHQPAKPAAPPAPAATTTTLPADRKERDQSVLDLIDPL